MAEEEEFVVSGESSADEEPDIHICGRCRKEFTELSKYLSHKEQKVCHHGAAGDIASRANMALLQQRATGQDGSKTQNAEIETENLHKEADNVTVQISQGNVEVQILEPLEPHEFLEVGASDSNVSQSPLVRRKAGVAGDLSGKHATKKNKRKSSTPKTTRKHKKKKSSVIGGTEMNGTECSPDNITVHIPESQLVHLMPPSSKSGKVIYRKQDATSVFVPIYLSPGGRKKSYKCSKCPAEFRSKEEQQSHLTMHKRDVKCTLCGKAFYTLESLQRHQERESHSHPCDQCGRVFPLEILLKRHAPSHSTNRAFICDVCDKGYPSETSLQAHKRNVHATEKKHKCPECGKAFVRKDKMRRHELIHFPDTRPTFPCPFRAHLGCTKTFYREDKLKRHLFTHSDVKPYKCDICQKTFARRDNLTDHMRIHTGIFGNPCHICKKGYQGPNRLKRHLKSAHGIEPVESLPTMVSRESSTVTTTVDLSPLTRSRDLSAAEEPGWEDSEQEDGSPAGFGTSSESGTSEEVVNSKSMQQLPPIAKLASHILPRTRANPRLRSEPLTTSTCAISEGLRVSSEALSMIGNMDHIPSP